MVHRKFLFLQAAVTPKPGEECIKLKAAIGYNGNGRGNMVWSPRLGRHNTQVYIFENIK